MIEFSSMVRKYNFNQFSFAVTKLLFEECIRDYEDEITRLKSFNLRPRKSGLIDVIIGDINVEGVNSYAFLGKNGNKKVQQILDMIPELVTFLKIRSITFVSKEPQDRSIQTRHGYSGREDVHVSFMESQDFNSRANRIEYCTSFRRAFPKTPSDEEMKIWFAGLLNKHHRFIHHIQDRQFRENYHRVLGTQLNQAYKERDIVLFLGTGVSINSNGPSWSKLVQELRIKMFEKIPKTRNLDATTREVMCDVLSNKFDPLIDAEQIWHGIEAIPAGNLSKYLKDILYPKESVRGVTKSKIIDGKILSCIARFCSIKGKGVRAVVTYNWDDLLERLFTSKGVKYKVITSDKDTYETDQIPVYHVHGFLPEDRTKYPHIEEEVPIVFRESEYHSLYRNPYHWSNHIQLQFLREHTCVFIGLSMTDPNLRRLLRISSERHDDARHFVHLEWSNAFDFVRKSIPHHLKELIEPREIHEGLDDENANTIARQQQSLVEEDLKDLGVKTVWGRDHMCVNRFLQQSRRTKNRYNECKFKKQHP